MCLVDDGCVGYQYCSSFLSQYKSTQTDTNQPFPAGSSNRLSISMQRPLQVFHWTVPSLVV